MKTPSLRSKLKPHLWFQAYWVIYLIWFFWLDLTIKNPKYIIHSPIDDLIPFNEWFIFPYCSWFVLLAAVTAMLWWYDTESYDKLCLMMFSGMTLCLMIIRQRVWKADSSVNVCPSIHCQSSGCMALAFSQSKLAKHRPALKAVAWVWAGLICLSTVFTKQHSIIDVVCGLVLVAVWVPFLYGKKAKIAD